MQPNDRPAGRAYQLSAFSAEGCLDLFVGPRELLLDRLELIRGDAQVVEHALLDVQALEISPEAEAG